MASIHLQFVLEDCLSSKVISWFSAGHFSHVDCIIYYPEIVLIGLVGARSDRIRTASQSYPPGVHLRPFNYAKWIHRAVMEVPCTEEQKSRYHQFLYDQLGKPYDFSAIWGFLFNRDWRAPDSWICSELQCAAGEASGILPPLFLPANKITPVACAVAFSAVGGKINHE